MKRLEKRRIIWRVEDAQEWFLRVFIAPSLSTLAQTFHVRLLSRRAFSAKNNFRAATSMREAISKALLK